MAVVRAVGTARLLLAPGVNEWLMITTSHVPRDVTVRGAVEAIVSRRANRELRHYDFPIPLLSDTSTRLPRSHLIFVTHRTRGTDRFNCARLEACIYVIISSPLTKLYRNLLIAGRTGIMLELFKDVLEVQPKVSWKC